MTNFGSTADRLLKRTFTAKQFGTTSITNKTQLRPVRL